MDKCEVYPIKALSMVTLIMVTLLTMSSFDSGGAVAGPLRHLPIVVASLN
jgi:hypothetical protein